MSALPSERHLYPQPTPPPDWRPTTLDAPALLRATTRFSGKSGETGLLIKGRDAPYRRVRRRLQPQPSFHGCTVDSKMQTKGFFGAFLRKIGDLRALQVWPQADS